MCAAGRTKDAGESLLKLVNAFDEEVHASEPIIEWISGEFSFTCLILCIQAFPSDFSHRCLSSPESDAGAFSKVARHDNAPVRDHVSPTPTPLLREWARATLAKHSWKDALVAASHVGIFFCSGTARGIDNFGVEFVVPRFMMYRVICERLETIDRITLASECFRQMVDELEQEVQGEEAKWVFGE